ncbi:hypothetical protein FBY04_11722 [Pseudomonas sp. SJZ080]|nr:hypothetical protein FBY04_11722 [Pseudomonas sp. SJZ080]
MKADSFLLHRKSKTPPEKGGVFTSLDGLRRFWTLSQLNKYTSQGERSFGRAGRNSVARGLAPVRLRSSRELLGPLRDTTGASPLATKVLCQGFALDGLGADHTAAIIIRRAPFADVFDVAKTPQADLLFIQPTHAAARRRHRRADIAVKRFGRTNGGRLGHDLTDLRNRVRRRLAA